MLKRVILLCLGFGALGLGALGAALPVLPTTPFVLCAAGCFGASSPRLYARLERTRYFGEYIRNYREKTGVSRRAKATGLAFLWGMLLLSGWFMRHSPVMPAVLAVIGVAVTVHILMLRSAKAGAGQPAETPAEPGG